MVYTENKLSPKLNWIINCCYCSVAQLCLTPCTCMNCSIPGFSVLHHLLKLAYIHWITYAIQPSYPLSSPSPPAFNNQCRIIIICEEIGFFFHIFFLMSSGAIELGRKKDSMSLAFTGVIQRQLSRSLAYCFYQRRGGSTMISLAPYGSSFLLYYLWIWESQLSWNNQYHYLRSSVLVRGPCTTCFDADLCSLWLTS